MLLLAVKREIESKKYQNICDILHRRPQTKIRFISGENNLFNLTSALMTAQETSSKEVNGIFSFFTISDKSAAAAVVPKTEAALTSPKEQQVKIKL